MATTLKDIAQRIGLTTASVSRILNNKGNFYASEETRAKVLEVANELQYKPNSVAKALVTGKTNSVAVVINMATSSQFYGSILQNFSDYFSELGIDIIVSSPCDQILTKVDAIVTWDQTSWLAEKMKQYALRGIVVVPIGQYINLYTCFRDTINLDQKDVVKQAMVHLLAQGCRNITMVHHLDCVQWETWGDYVHHGYKQIMEDNRLNANCLMPAIGSKAHYKKFIMDYLAVNPVPDAFLCRYDDIAIGIAAGLMELGIRIPEDVCLVTCDGTEDCEFSAVPISAINKPIDVICAAAAKLVARRLKNNDATVQNKIFKPEFIVRRSSNRNADVAINA